MHRAAVGGNLHALVKEGHPVGIEAAPGTHAAVKAGRLVVAGGRHRLDGRHLEVVEVASHVEARQKLFLEAERADQDAEAVRPEGRRWAGAGGHAAAIQKT